MWLVAFSILISAATGPTTPHADSIPAFIAEIYGPYFSEGDPRHRPWSQGYEDRPIWSAQTTALFKTWRRLPKEADSINDQDGLCDCQARNGRFDAHVLATEQPDRDHALVDIETENGTVGPTRLRLSIVRERGRWRLEDVYWVQRKAWLKATLRAEIAADSQP